MDLDVAGGAVHVRLARSEAAPAPCPECQTPCTIYHHRDACPDATLHPWWAGAHGGCEAMLLGGARPTGDIDFGVVHAGAGRWPEVEAAILAAAAASGVAVQYSTDIDRWSSVAIPPRRFKTRRFRRVGRLGPGPLLPGLRG